MIAFLRRHRLFSLSIIVAVVLIAVSLLLTNAKSSLGHPDPVGPTVYSKSAIGHAAFFALLEDLDIPVRTSDAGSGGHVTSDSVLFIAEPRSDSETLDEVRAMLAADEVVLVLPKRVGEADKKRPNWLGHDEIFSAEDVERVLRLVDEKASVVRVDGFDPLADSHLGDGRPVIHPAQLIRSSVIKPLLASPDGVLVGEYQRRGRRVIVLADPDLISNFGLPRGDDATVAVRLIEYARRGHPGPVVFDEFVHGFADRPFHILGILFQFPFLLISVQIGFAVLLLLWAAGGRFGAPPESGPAIAAGKRSLIETGARLLDRPGHAFGLTERYFEAIVRDAGRQAHAPRGLDLASLVQWLSRGERTSPPALPTARNDQAALMGARDIFEWRKGLRDEP